jgi:hypothetical protein
MGYLRRDPLDRVAWVGYGSPSLQIATPWRLESMSVLIRKYKLPTGIMQEERIDDPDRIERYLRIFEKEDVKKLQAGGKVVIEKDEWQLLP